MVEMAPYSDMSQMEDCSKEGLNIAITQIIAHIVIWDLDPQTSKK